MNGRMKGRRGGMLKNIGRRLLVLLLTMTMVIGLMPVQAVQAEAITVSNLRWDGNIARWDVSGNATKYKVGLYNATSGTWVNYETTDTFYDFSESLFPGNQYRFSVNPYLGDVAIGISESSPMKKKEGSIGNIPVTIDPNTRIARWTEVSGTDGFKVYVFINNQQIGNPIGYNKTVTMHDFSSRCIEIGSGSYCVRVAAVKGRSDDVLAEGRSEAVEIDPFAPVTVSYDPNGGSGSVDSITMDVGETYTYPDTCGFTAPFGREFAGWEDHMGKMHEAGSTTTLYAGAVVKPVWKNVTTYVTYDANRTLSGVVGTAFAQDAAEAEDKTQYINVYFEGLALSERGDASAIRIKNLPAGLEQSIHWIEGTNTARICVYGTPTQPSTDQVELEIGEESTTFGSNLIFTENNSGTRFYITEGEQVKKINLTAGLPNKIYTGGRLPRYTSFSVPEEAGYQISDFGWYEAGSYDADMDGAEKLSTGTSFNDGSVLEAGKKYYAVFNVKTNAGYVFAPETELKSYINNSRVDVSLSRENDGSVIIKKAYTAQNAADAKYTVKYVDFNDESNTWTDDVNGVGTAYTLTDYLEAPAGKEHRSYVLRSGTGNDDTTANTFYHPGDIINVYSNLIFDAAWKDRTYTVHFDAGIGSGTMEDVTDAKKEYTLPECTFTPPANRKFYKWKYDGVLYDPGDKITIEDGYFSKTTQITLMAMWCSDAEDIVDTITVTGVVPPVGGVLPSLDYDLLEDSHVHIATEEEIADAVYKYSTEHNYGWTHDFCLTNARTEIRAKDGWIKGTKPDGYSYYTYDSQYKYGGNGFYDEWKTGTPFESDGKYRLSLYLSTEEGYTFDDNTIVEVAGLTEGIDYDETTVAVPGQTSSGGTLKLVYIDFTAKKDKMNITFAAGEGSGIMEAVEVDTGSEYTLPECSFTEPDGKVFDRWKIGEKLYSAGSKITVKEDLTLTAVWGTDARPYYTVKVTNDGLGTAAADVDNDEAKAGTKVTLTPTPKAGQSFKHWMVVAAPGDSLEIADDGSFTMPEGDVEIMACFHDHDYTENADDKYLKYPAGCVGKAVYFKSCKVCGIKGEETFEHGEALGHTWADEKGVKTKDPSCEEHGELTFTCTVCGAVEKQKTDSLGHDWNAATYEWAPDYSTVTASRSCKRVAAHKETETVYTKITGGTATCDKAGTVIYTAEFENPDFKKQEKTVNSEALGHDWGEWTEVTPAKETEPGLEKRVCKNDASHEETREIPALNHLHDLKHYDRVEATETVSGNIEYWECTGCGRYFSDAEGKNEIEKEATVIPAEKKTTPGSGDDETPTPGSGDDVTPTPALKEGEVYISPEDMAVYVTPANVSQDKTASVTIDGKTVSLNLRYEYTNAVTYTGEKILPDSKLINAKLNLGDILSQVSANEGVKLMADEVFDISFKASNNKDASRAKKASFFAKIKIKKGVDKQMPKAEYKKLKKLVSASNKLLKANKCEFTINPKPVTESSPEIAAKFNKDGSIKTAKRTGFISGEKVWVSLTKKTKLSKAMYATEAPVTSENGTVTVKLTGKKNFTGTAVVTVSK